MYVFVYMTCVGRKFSRPRKWIFSNVWCGVRERLSRFNSSFGPTTSPTSPICFFEKITTLLVTENCLTREILGIKKWIVSPQILLLEEPYLAPYPIGSVITNIVVFRYRKLKYHELISTPTNQHFIMLLNTMYKKYTYKLSSIRSWTH